MDENFLKSYLDGWSRICSGTPEPLAAMIAGAHPEIRFTDVNSPNTHVGYEGIRAICELASRYYPGATVEYRDLLFDGRNWSIRWVFSGPRQGRMLREAHRGHCHGQPLAEFELWRVIFPNDQNQLRWLPLPS